MCRDLELAVPGTYDPNQPIIRIQSIAPSLQVITSKQRPRKLTIMGKTHRGPDRPVLYARGNQRRLEGISAGILYLEHARRLEQIQSLSFPVQALFPVSRP